MKSLGFAAVLVCVMSVAVPEPGALASPAAQAVRKDFLLVSAFDRAVCGSYSHPPPECEFGIEGDVATGAFSPRTGGSALRINRLSIGGRHMGAIALVPLPVDRPVFWGVSHKIPAIPPEAWNTPMRAFEIQQMSPTDGVTPGWPVEVRIYEDRTLGLALWSSKTAVRTTYRVPIDEWFSVVVKLQNGDAAIQQMVVYDAAGHVVARVSATLDTRVTWVHGTRFAQKVGGNTPAPAALQFLADDWYISLSSHGPMRVTT